MQCRRPPAPPPGPPLGERRGLVVLDDLASGRDIDALRPLPSWSVVATTRVQELHPASRQLVLRPMERSEAVQLLGRLRYGTVEDEALALTSDSKEMSAGRARLLRARGDLHLRNARIDDAEADYEAAIHLFRSVHDRIGEANVLQGRGDLEAGREAWAKALVWYRSARELYVQVDDSLGLSNVDAELARTHSALGGPRTAVRAAATALIRGTQAQNGYAIGVAREVLERHADAIPDDLRPQLAELLGEAADD